MNAKLIKPLYYAMVVFGVGWLQSSPIGNAADIPVAPPINSAPPGNPAISQPTVASGTAVGTASPVGTAADNATSMKPSGGATGPAPDAVINRKMFELRVDDSLACYRGLQAKSDLAVFKSVRDSAKAIVIFDCWTASGAAGGAVGTAVAFKRDALGKFRGPVFYHVVGGSLGAQAGDIHIKTVAFLMSEKSVQTLGDAKFVWGGNLRAIAGDQATAWNAAGNGADVVLYKAGASLDVGTFVSAAKLTVDEEGDQKYYDSTAITSSDIFNHAELPANARDLFPEVRPTVEHTPPATK